MENTLFIIPARGGSKGIPGKNIKKLNGRPLIQYSIAYARKFVSDQHICVSTDSEEIVEVVEQHCNLSVPFRRPEHLATDRATSNDVILHAWSHYQELGKYYDFIVLLQPTSPFRETVFLEDAFRVMNEHSDTEMVISVFETESNPYYVLMEEGHDGVLHKSKQHDATRRQDVPKVYEVNGSIYLINTKSLSEKKAIRNFTRIRKVEMDRIHSVDIDNEVDWSYCEFLLEKGLVNV